MINQPPPLSRDYNRDPNIILRPLKGGGLLTMGLHYDSEVYLACTRTKEPGTRILVAMQASLLWGLEFFGFGSLGLGRSRSPKSLTPFICRLPEIMDLGFRI